MKNKLYVVLLFVSFSSLVVSQANNNEKEQESLTSVKEGDFLVSVFFSYPNWQAFFTNKMLKSGISFGVQADQSTIKVGGISPLGLKMEYMLTDLFGFTFDGIYDSWKADWKDVFGNNNSVYRERYRFQLGINYHMNDLNSDRLDVYGGLAIGSNYANYRVKQDVELSNSVVEIAKADPYPVSFRVRAGGRYFFNDALAINFEVALGGPVLSFGMTYRMNN